MNQAYWAQNPQGPFATLIAVAATYCHPEVHNDAYPELIERVRSAAPEDEQIRVFREELGEALADPSRLPDDELSKAVQYDDGSSQAFLRRLWRRLWRDLYGGEPAAGA